MTPLSLATRVITIPSSMESASGFWQYTCLPARIAATEMRACQWSGVQTTTASTVGSATTARQSETMRHALSLYEASIFCLNGTQPPGFFPS